MPDSHLIVGAGAGGHGLATVLAASGVNVVLYEHPSRALDFKPTLESNSILLTDELEGHDIVVPIDGATMDAEAALSAARLIHIVSPSYAHDALFDQILPHLREEHLVCIWAGNLGSLRLRNLLSQEGRPSPVVCETDTMPFGARFLAPGHIRIFARADRILFAALPVRATDGVLAELRSLIPQVTQAQDVMSVALSNVSAKVHVPVALFNLGMVEGRSEYRTYFDAMTPSVVKLVQGLHGETEALGRALSAKVIEYRCIDYAQTGSIASTSFSGLFHEIRGIKDVSHRYLTEEVPFQLVLWSELGKASGVPTPLSDAMVTLAGWILQTDFRAEGRTLESIGLTDKSASEITVIVRDG